VKGIFNKKRTTRKRGVGFDSLHGLGGKAEGNPLFNV